MVEFEHQPWKKIIVHEVVKYPIEFFITQHSLGVEPRGIGGSLNWADGVVFDIGHFRDTDDVIREKLEGKLHYSSVIYGLLEKYQSEFEVAGNIRIPVIDVSHNKIFKEMATWIKKTLEGKWLNLPSFSFCVQFLGSPRKNSCEAHS